jgi:hypothetical protein
MAKWTLPALARRLVPLAALAVLLVPTSQAWVWEQYGPVQVHAKVNPPSDPTQPQDASATVLVCSDHDTVSKVDVEPDPGLVTVWVPDALPGDGGSQRTTAGCGPEEDTVEVSIWVCNTPLF